ncbi:lipopolysaccharide heptosyltransferase II [Candidatus Omnitrophota bacterium]
MTDKRILIFNVNWLGDVLFSTAVIRNLRYNYPDAFIACIVPTRCYQILKGNPNLDEVIIFDDESRQGSIFAKIKFIKSLREKRFDTAYLLHRSFTRALICMLAGITQRIGYYTRKRALLLTKKIPPLDPAGLHRIDYYLNVIEKAGLKVKDRFTEFFFKDEDEGSVQDFLNRENLKQEDFLVGINPGGNWLLKRWPKDYWARLSDQLIGDLKAKVVICGGVKDSGLAREIAKGMKERPIIACGAFSLKQFGAFCKKMDLFISADTGPLHIANAVGTKKIIALYGPTSPAITGPYPKMNAVVLQKCPDCKIPCYAANCRDNRCMKQITPDDVIREVKKIRDERSS